MPVYAFECCECSYVEDRLMSVSKRHEALNCPECHGLGTMLKMLTAPHIAPIPGIPNRINQHWNEGDRDTKVIPMDGRRDERREKVKALSKKSARRKAAQSTGDAT